MTLSRLALLVACLADTALAEPMPEAVTSYGPADAPLRLLVRGAVDTDAFGPVLDAFVTARPGLRVDFEQWLTNDLYQGSAKACATGAPSADLIVSSAVDLQVKLVNDGCAQPYLSTATQALPPGENWRDELFGVTSEPAVMVYNRRLVPPEEAPASRFDLLDLLRPDDNPYSGRVATYDIEVSGVGYLFAFLDAQQATTFGSLIEAFGRTGAVATCCSAEIIDGVADGRYLVAYNVLGSYAMARAARNPDLVVVAPEDYTLVLSRAVLVPRQAAEPEAAGELIDFLLSERGHRVLESQRLALTTDNEAGRPSPFPPDVVLRPISLSPVLLVGLDRQIKARIIALWRSTFSHR